MRNFMFINKKIASLSFSVLFVVLSIGKFATTDLPDFGKHETPNSSLSRTYKISLDKHENEFGFVLHHTNDDFLLCSENEREKVLKEIYKDYYDMNPELISSLGEDAVFIVEEVK